MAQQTALARPLPGATAAAPPEQLAVLRTKKPRSLWSDAWKRLLRNRMAVVGMCVVVLFWLTAIVAPLLAPYHYNSQYHQFTYVGPFWKSHNARFLLGTDGLGRDELSRLIYGSRISMVVGLIPVTIHLVIGGTVGMLAGYRGGRTDNLLMRLVDVFYALPGLLLVIIMSVAFRDTGLGRAMGGLMLIFVALSVVGWEGTARIVRGQVLSVKQKEYVEAARALGANNVRVMWRHVAPNIMAPLIVGIAFAVPTAIFAEAGLSFIGLGVRPPTATWGGMISDGLSSINSNPTLIAAPALLIGLVMLSFTFVGDGLRDALDPRMKI